MPTADDDPQAPAPRFVKPDDATQPGSSTPWPGPSGDPSAPVFVNPDTPRPGDPRPVFVPPGGQPDGGPAFVKPGGPTGPTGRSLDGDRPWPWWLGLVAFVLAVFGIVPAQLGLAALISAIQGGSGVDIVQENTHWFGLMQDVAWIAIVLLLPFLVVKHLRPEQLGIKADRAMARRAIGVLFASAFAFYALAAAYSAVLGLSEDQNTLLQDTGFGDSVLKDALLAVLFTVAAPVAEELLFRGLLFRTLRDGLSRRGPRFGMWMGAILSGLIFGGLHIGGGQDAFVPVLMLLGIVLALAYHWSGTIYVPIAIHAFNNAVATGLNSDPKADWIYGLIIAGPILALLVTFLLARFIRRVFPAEPRARPGEPPAGPPAGPPTGLPGIPGTF